LLARAELSGIDTVPRAINTGAAPVSSASFSRKKPVARRERVRHAAEPRERELVQAEPNRIANNERAVRIAHVTATPARTPR